MIVFHFTKNNLVGSFAIRRALGEDCSHFAFEHNGMVIESRMEVGVKECGRNAFLHRNTRVHSLTLKYPDADFEMRLLNSIYDNARGKTYDQKAILFWCAAALANRWFGRPYPDQNKWGTKGSHTCVEILRGSENLLSAYLGIDLLNRELEMTSPHMLYLTLKKSGKLVDM